MTRNPCQKPTSHAGLFHARGDSRLRVLISANGLETAWLAFLLRLDGHRAVLAPDGPSALRKAQAQPPDVVLLDMAIIGMNGWHVGRQIWAHESRPKPLMIAVTEYGQRVDSRLAWEAGIHLRLVKPVDPVFLLKLLRRFEAIVPARTASKVKRCCLGTGVESVKASVERCKP
jgi:CheY-like chemotaxis protein